MPEYIKVFLEKQKKKEYNYPNNYKIFRNMNKYAIQCMKSCETAVGKQSARTPDFLL